MIQSNSNGPSNFFQKGVDKYPNPFYEIALQYLPLNIDHMLWWAQHICHRKGFFRSAMERVAGYFITDLTIETDNEKEKDIYKEAFEAINWKEVLSQAGLDLLVYSNSFASINQGFERFICCPQCKKQQAIDRFKKFSFNKGVYTGTCESPKCNFKGKLLITDVPSNEIEDINVVHWPAREIKIQYEDTRNKAEYFWDIPNDYSKKVSKKDNKFFAKNTPMEIFECIFASGGARMLAFDKRNFIHLKIPNPTGIRTDGKSIPLIMYMFDDVFMHQTLQRLNQVICFEDIAPFRVFSLADNTNPQSLSILSQSAEKWTAGVDSMLTEHRRDPGSYHKFPFPLSYQQLGGQGKELVPADLMEKSKTDILAALNVPAELFNMTLQAQAVGPALRMFENAWRVVPANYNRMLQKTADVIARIKKIGPAKVSIIDVTFADDMERKSIIGQLVSANVIAKSELLKTYGFDYKDQVKKKNEEDKIVAELQKEEQERAQLEQSSEASIFGQQGGQGGGTPQDAISQAQEIAQKLFPLDGAQRREQLQQIKAQDQTLWANVKGALEEMTNQSKSQGTQQAKQQAQQQ